VSRRSSPIAFKDIRPLGIGRLTSCVESTSHRTGSLIGSAKGLFHLADTDSTPRRLRRNPVGFIVSGETGAVCYEEVKGHGRLAVLDHELEERKTDLDLARTINPVAFLSDGIIIFHKAEFVCLDLATGARTRLAEFVATHTMTPLVRVPDGFEFIASYREPRWPTFLHKLILPVEKGGEGMVEVLARAEDPVMSRQFLKLSDGYYLTIPQGRPIFLVYKVFAGAEAGIRTWMLIPIAGDAQPVGMVKVGRALLAACADSLCVFSLSAEFETGRPPAEEAML
jgi:hypothetical protein